nr:hypothetical chloroplast RF15 [Celosia argentea]UUL98489.1 hypothetical chloroplast RF15 [Celosia argentea]
MPTGVYY